MGTKIEEIWKDVIGYEGLYKVSNFGRVLSLKGLDDRLLSLNKNTKGYYHVILCRCLQKRVYLVHRLVAENFLNNHFFYPVVNHIDGNVTNNHVANLEWCTQSYNLKHGIERRKKERA